MCLEIEEIVIWLAFMKDCYFTGTIEERKVETEGTNLWLCQIHMTSCTALKLDKTSKRIWCIRTMLVLQLQLRLPKCPYFIKTSFCWTARLTVPFGMQMRLCGVCCSPDIIKKKEVIITCMNWWLHGECKREVKDWNHLEPRLTLGDELTIPMNAIRANIPVRSMIQPRSMDGLKAFGVTQNKNSRQANTFLFANIVVSINCLVKYFQYCYFRFHVSRYFHSDWVQMNWCSSTVNRETLFITLCIRSKQIDYWSCSASG